MSMTVYLYSLGPMLATGDELAAAASKALGEDLKFENISECVPLLFHEDCTDQVLLAIRSEARKVLRAQAGSDDSEIQYLLEYYSLVREGKTNYISTTTFHDVTGGHPQEPPDFFRTYAQDLHPKRSHKRRKRSTK